MRTPLPLRSMTIRGRGRVPDPDIGEPDTGGESGPINPPVVGVDTAPADPEHRLGALQRRQRARG